MENDEKKKREREIIVRCRAIAVFLVVLAHCNALPDNSSFFAQKAMEFCSSISFFGVWLFFMLGGYLFKYEKRSFTQIALRKAKTIVVPWVSTGILVYVYTDVRHGGISVKSMLQFVTGYGSYLWYMSVFIVLLVIFSAARRIKLFPYLLIAAAILVEITRIQYKLAGTDYKLYYFFVGAWPIAFGLGYLINQSRWRKGIYAHVKKYGALWAIAALAAVFAVFMSFGRWYYWSKCYIPLCLVATPGMLWLVLALEKYISAVLDEIGGISFSIYLLHMPVAGIVSNILCRFDRGLTVPIRPFIVIALTWVGIRMICWLGEKARMTGPVNMLIGRR